MSLKPEAHKISNLKDSFFLAEDLKIYNPDYFSGTSKTIRKIIEKKLIPESEIIYAYKVNDVWKVFDSTSKKAKLFISKNFTEKNIFKNNSKKEILPDISPKKNQDISESTDTDSLSSEYNDDNIEIAPNILHLEEEEKFKDYNNKIIEIETRGTRERKNIFFKVKDISIGFGLPNLKQSLFDVKGSYERNIHYKTFIRNNSVVISDQKLPIKKALYLTYKGLLRVLFVSRNRNAEYFQDWAEDKLFTIQMGKEEKKEELGSEILNISVKSYRAVFKSHASHFPSIYLLRLGTTKELRKTFNISQTVSDDTVVYKYGYTESLERRLREHSADYGKLKNVNITIPIYHFVDIKYASEAENDLKQFFKNFKKSIDVDGRNELIALDDDAFKQVRNLYRHIGIDYAGATLGLQKQIEELKQRIQQLENEIKELKYIHEIEILKKDREIEKNEMLLEQKKLEISNKDLLIQLRELQLDKIKNI